MDDALFQYSQDKCLNWHYLDAVLLKVHNSHSIQKSCKQKSYIPKIAFEEQNIYISVGL